MEPQIPNPNFSRGPSGKEVGPSLPAPESYGSFPETHQDSLPELQQSYESKEIKAQQRQPQTQLPPSAVSAPSVPSDTTVAGQTQASQGGVPLAAADDDVIEKEWVTKAKKVIKETQGNPYLQEKEVSKLQADYLQKRYGKQVKIPEDV